MAALALLNVSSSFAAGAGLSGSGEGARDTGVEGLRLLETQEPRLRALGIRMGYVESDTRPGNGNYLCGGLSGDDAIGAASEVASALDYLSDGPMGKVHLRYVVLCGKVLAGQQAIGGFPMPSSDMLMLDASGTRDPAAFRHGVLHELYHLLEFRYGRIDDPGWTAQFSGYTNSYPLALHGGSVGSGKVGFVNDYAQTFAREERAELFAFLMMAPQDVASRIRQADDRVLRLKTRYLVDACQQMLGLSLSSP